MKKLLILLILFTIFLSGCGLYNLNYFVLPDDAEFLALIQELDTPRKICQYMTDNFESEEHPYINLTPYQLYITKKGDCNDFASFAIFIAHYHGYETYNLLIFYPAPVYQKDTWHSIAIYKEGDYYTISEFNNYKYWIQFKDFQDILNYFDGWTIYKIYDYYNKLIEQGTNN